MGDTIGPDASIDYLENDRAAWLQAAQQKADFKIILSMATGKHLPSTEDEKEAYRFWLIAQRILGELHKKGVTFDDNHKMVLPIEKEQKTEFEKRIGEPIIIDLTKETPKLTKRQKK